MIIDAQTNLYGMSFHDVSSPVTFGDLWEYSGALSSECIPLPLTCNQ